jgi:lysyl-tRNA synthetase class 2
MTTPQQPAATHESVTAELMVDTNKLVAERREKLAAIRAQGVAFPNDFKPADRAAPLHAAHGATEAEPLEAQAIK